MCDTSEGNINHVHDRTGWCVTATLVRHGQPVLTAVHVPLSGETLAAAAGQGAECGGAALYVSAKADLAIAMVATGQAMPGEDEATRRRLERGVGRMLDRALLVRMSVPSTIELINVARGRLDAFWQPSAVRSGLLSGALLVREAGGIVTDFAGKPWSLSSGDFLASNAGIHAAVSAALTD